MSLPANLAMALSTSFDDLGVALTAFLAERPDQRQESRQHRAPTAVAGGYAE